MWLTDLVHPGCYWSSPSQLLQPKLVNTDDCIKEERKEKGRKEQRGTERKGRERGGTEEGELEEGRYEGRKGERESWGVEGGGTDTVVHCTKWPVHCSKTPTCALLNFLQTAHPRWLIRDSALGTTPTLECWLWPNPRAYRNTMRKEMEENSHSHRAIWSENSNTKILFLSFKTQK